MTKPIWQNGMYVLLHDFESIHELAIVEDWIRGRARNFTTKYKDADCLGCAWGNFNYWYSVLLTNRLTPQQALAIVKASEPTT